MISQALKTTALLGIETAINQCLRLEPETGDAIARLSGKVIAIELTGVNQIFYLLPGEKGVTLQSTLDGEPDTTIRGTPLAMVRLGLASDRKDALFSGDVEILGDTDTGEQLQKILDTLDIDWEEHLSHLVGDIIAHQAGNVARGLREWSRQTINNLCEDTTDYLREEKRLLPHRFEIEEFMSSVDTLRDDTERLEKRVARLHQSLQGNKG